MAMMKRKDALVALVAGATVGIGAGTLGAFLLCTAAQTVVLRCLNLMYEQYLEFGQPAPSLAQPGGRQASPVRTPLTLLASDRSPRPVPVA